MPPARSSSSNPFASTPSPYYQGPANFGRRTGAVGTFSRRNVRGAGWHKRGYRDSGCMWINVRRGSYGHTRGQDVREDMSITEFWNDVIRGVSMEDGFPLPEGYTIGLFSNRKMLPRSDTDRIDTIFDGGETVYVKVFDEDDNERVYDFGSGSWEYHVPGRRH